MSCLLLWLFFFGLYETGFWPSRDLSRFPAQVLSVDVEEKSSGLALSRSKDRYLLSSDYSEQIPWRYQRSVYRGRHGFLTTGSAQRDRLSRV